MLPGVEVLGVDKSAAAIRWARTRTRQPGIDFQALSEFSDKLSFDLCYCNGVFHHIEPQDRLPTLKRIKTALVRGGRLALFENNPLNPFTHLVMARIPFDREARCLWSGEARRLLAAAGFSPPQPTRFLFFFPRLLARLRFLEPRLARVPFGAQYLLLARAPA
jgi:SAM-dependent methyltransferase